MKKNLIYYGYIPDWKNVFDIGALLSSPLGKFVNNILIFETIPSLRNYLCTDGKNYKNYIFPVKVENIEELNGAKINSLFKVDSYYLKHFNNKQLFVQYVHKNNIRHFVPESYTKLSNRNSDELVIIKPKESYYSIGTYMKPLREVEDKDFDGNIVQKYVYDDNEYAAYAVCYNGKITQGFAYVSNYGKQPFIKNAGGVWDRTPQQRVVMDNDTIQKLEKFLTPCLYTGVCSIDFKISYGRLYVLEINPRLGGSLNDADNINDLVNVILDLMRIYDERNVYN
jgi:hypothetical protein